jgi:hypothetical protein
MSSKAMIWQRRLDFKPKIFPEMRVSENSFLDHY